MRASHAALSANTLCLWDSGESQLWKHLQLQHSFTGINWICLRTSRKCRQITYFVAPGSIKFVFFPLSCFYTFWGLFFFFGFSFWKITSKQNKSSFLIIKIISKCDTAPQKWILFPRRLQLCPDTLSVSDHPRSSH